MWLGVGGCNYTALFRRDAPGSLGWLCSPSVCVRVCASFFTYCRSLWGLLHNYGSRVCPLQNDSTTPILGTFKGLVWNEGPQTRCLRGPWMHRGGCTGASSFLGRLPLGDGVGRLSRPARWLRPLPSGILWYFLEQLLLQWGSSRALLK